MAPLEAVSVQMWVPPNTSTGQAIAMFNANMPAGTSGAQNDPNYLVGWNTQTVYEVGTAGPGQTYDLPAPKAPPGAKAETDAERKARLRGELAKLSALDKPTKAQQERKAVVENALKNGKK